MIKNEKIFSDVNKIFGVTKNIKKTENPIIKDINKYKSVIKKTKIENTTLGFGFRIPKKLTKNKAELRVLNAVLGLGTSSRFSSICKNQRRNGRVLLYTNIFKKKNFALLCLDLLQSQKRLWKYIIMSYI